MGCLIVYFCVIEGKGRTLEEMDMMYVMRIPPWKSSKWVPPPLEQRVTTGDLVEKPAAEAEKRQNSGAGQKYVEDSGAAGPSS